MLLLFVATLVNARGRERNVKDRHQLQLHAALAYLRLRDDRIVEYKLHDDALTYTQAVEYCRDAGGAIAQPTSFLGLFTDVQGMSGCSA